MEDRIFLGQVLVLNGPSSSGKTTLARMLQARLPTAHQHVQLDAFRAMEPEGYWVLSKREGPAVVALRTTALCRAMGATVRTYALHGQNTIFDVALVRDSDWRDFLYELGECPALLIGVVCDVEELARRERGRGDRELGLAAAQAMRIHAGRPYDTTVDSGASSAEQCAAQILEWLAKAPEPKAWDNLRSRLGIPSRGVGS